VNRDVHAGDNSPLRGDSATRRFTVVSRSVLAVLTLLLLAAPAWADVAEEVDEFEPGDDECTVVAGDFDAEQAPLCSGSCAWADVPPAAIVDILRHPAGWAHHFRVVVEARLLGGGRLLQVQKAKPFARRQVTIEFEVDEGAGGYRVTWTKASRQEPLVKGRVEVVLYDGWWEVRPDGRGGSLVSHGARFDPGPGIPRKFVKAGMPRHIRKLLRQLRRAVEERGA